MKRTILNQGPPEEPGSWRYKRVGDTVTAAVTCPNGHQGDLANHYIGRGGNVMQIAKCGESGCDFEAHIQLAGWRPLNIVKGPNGSNTVALFPAHNRLADTHREQAFSGLVLMEKIKNILLEAVAEAQGEPSKWVNIALMKYRFIAMRWEDLRMALPPGARLPPPDEDGLVNWVAFIDANPQLFPSFHNPEWRQAFDRSHLALPKMFQA